MEIKPCEKALDRQDTKRVANLKASLRSKGGRQFPPTIFTENVTSTAQHVQTLFFLIQPIEFSFYGIVVTSRRCAQSFVSKVLRRVNKNPYGALL